MITRTQQSKSVPVFAGSKMMAEMPYNVNVVTGKSWRLIHDGVSVILLCEGTDEDTTTTIYNVEEFETKDAAVSRIGELGLTIKE